MAQTDQNETVISGVVGGVGGGGGFLHKDGTWTSLFHVVAWRLDDGPVRTDELRVEIPEQQKDDLEKWASVFPPRTLVTFSINRPLSKKHGRTLAILQSPLATVDDKDLLAAADPILNPPDFVDAEFGTFKSDATFPDWFQQKREWLGVDVELTLSAEEGSLDDAARTLRSVWAEREAWDAKMREAIADQYYDVWLDGWNEGQPDLTREEFKARFVIGAPAMRSDGTFGFYYGDDDLFWGHSMSVSASLHDDAIDVVMVG